MQASVLPMLKNTCSSGLEMMKDPLAKHFLGLLSRGVAHPPQNLASVYLPRLINGPRDDATALRCHNP